MTRKRAVKLLMARGCSRNQADYLMRAKPPGHSNGSHYARITLARRLRDHSLAYLRLLAIVRAATESMSKLARAIIECKGGVGL